MAIRRPGPRTLRLAHRGDHRHHPENSIASFVAATDLPACDGIEFDVRLSRDGVPVVLHDATLERVQRVPAVAADMTAEELECAGVPTLAAVLAAVPRKAFLDIELKVPIGRVGLEVLAAGRGQDLGDAVISSFDEEALRRFRGLAPTWPRWLNAVDLAPATIRRAQLLECSGIAVEWHAIDEQTSARVAAAGLALAAWTVTRRPTYARLAQFGLAAICAEGNTLDG
jgi:glycerophosphoryl diester phosphodiesterase